MARVGKPQGLEAIPGGVRVRFPEAEDARGRSPYLGHGRSPYLEAVFLEEDLLCLTWFPPEPLPPYALAEGKGEASPVEPERLEGGRLLKTPRLALRVGEEGLTLWMVGEASQAGGLPRALGKGLAAPGAPFAGGKDPGLGERAYPLDRRGGVFRFWNRDPGGSYGPGEDPLYLSVPLWLSLRPEGEYLVFFTRTLRRASPTSWGPLPPVNRGGRRPWWAFLGEPSATT